MGANPEIRTCLVCTNIDCAARGSLQLFQSLKENLIAAGSGVALEEYKCFGGCEIGPNIITRPDGTWYTEVRPDDIPEITNHLLGGPPVERLTGKVDPALHKTILEILEGFGY